ncbi:MAG: hypothetical protein ACP5OZ_04815 [Candidatus Woesearchaeota archaeon]
MKNLMSSNLSEFKGRIIICGSCIPGISRKTFEKIRRMSKNIFFVCLEEIHMNMAAHKIVSILRKGNVKEIIFVTVDKSPHCVQLHYIRNEIEKIIKTREFEMKNFVISDNNLEEISPEMISISKNLCKIKSLIKKQKR